MVLVVSPFIIGIIFSSQPNGNFGIIVFLIWEVLAVGLGIFASNRIYKKKHESAWMAIVAIVLGTLFLFIFSFGYLMDRWLGA